VGELARLLLEMRERFALSYTLESVPDYAEYVKSPEYESFKAALVGRSEAAR
jgi:hypothetical protein